MVDFVELDRTVLKRSCCGCETIFLALEQMGGRSIHRSAAEKFRMITDRGQPMAVATAMAL